MEERERRKGAEKEREKEKVRESKSRKRINYCLAFTRRLQADLHWTTSYLVSSSLVIPRLIANGYEWELHLCS